MRVLFECLHKMRHGRVEHLHVQGALHALVQRNARKEAARSPLVLDNDAVLANAVDSPHDFDGANAHAPLLVVPPQHAAAGAPFVGVKTMFFVHAAKLPTRAV